MIFFNFFFSFLNKQKETKTKEQTAKPFLVLTINNISILEALETTPAADAAFKIVIIKYRKSDKLQ